MTNIVIPVGSKEESRFLLDLAKKLGYNPFSIEDSKMIARLKFVSLTDDMRKKGSNGSSMSEIQKEVDAVRSKRYGKKRKTKAGR